MGGILRSQFDANILVTVIKKTLRDIGEDEEAPMLEPPHVTGDPFTKYHFCNG